VQARDPQVQEKYGRGTPDDWIERVLYTKHRNWGIIALVILDLLLFGAPGITIIAVQMLAMPLLAAGIINGIGHHSGYRNFECPDAATNIVPWGVLLGGEELHNNHHAFPSSAKFALRRYEFDLGWALLRLFEKLRLARILRVAPQLDEREDVTHADAETLKAVLTHRFDVMTRYFRNVITPALRDEATRASDHMKALSRKLRRALPSDGRWLDTSAKERLSHWIAQSPHLATLYDYRRRLEAVLERSGKTSEVLLKSLQEWCADAERSGIRALQEFAQRLRGYTLRPTVA
jgi:stearoyl-CoA desaturase (delta-9 desaturase)